MRDGDRWQDYPSLPKWEFSAFELLAEVKGDAQFKLGGSVVAEVLTPQWTPIRIRVAANRSQVWLDNRVASDTIRETTFPSGALQVDDSKLRNIRIRKI